MLNGIFSRIGDAFGNIYIRDIIDILIIAVITYQLLKLTRQTRAIRVVKGLGVLIIAAWASEYLKLQTLNWLLNYVLNSGVIVVVVLFQPEIRRLLESIGQGGILKRASRILSSDNAADDSSAITDELFDAFVNLSRTRTGALVIIERDTALDSIMRSGTPVDARVTSALVENIFYPNTPLHDGAMIIRDGRIASAACILPLTQRADLEQTLGTRHRACIGMSENSDAYCFVVSEERGTISMAYDGKLEENYDSASLRAELKRIFGGGDKKAVSFWQRLRGSSNGGNEE